MPSVEEQIFAERAVDRENRLKEEKARVEQEVNQGYAAYREKFAKEMEEAREKSRQITAEKREELLQLRSQQARELADLDAQLRATRQEKLALSKAEGKLEVDKRRAELEKIQQDLEIQSELRRSQLNDTSEIMKNGEKLRQEMLNRCRDDRKKETEVMNAKTLEMNQKLHETKLAGEKRIQQLDDKRSKEQKAHFLKKEKIISNRILTSSALTSSLALEDAFEQFKQKCKGLRDQHKKFCIQYDTIEPQLLRVHNSMIRGRKLKGDCEMRGLQSAVRVFNEKANEFLAEGSTDEEHFASRIGQVIEIIRQLRIDFNGIESKIESYEDEDEGEEKDGKGIGEQLVNIVDKMKEMGELMQLFNVIGRDHLKETLAIQMEQAQSSRHAAITAAPPPVYHSSTKVTPAITEE
ncbi:hypothetical protein CAEBREN_20225 [Caenorhabditis brenneri]|uniref:Uncharacterized protein n=1 Tax=Caenorhabditis brenneri TaxID=135651 RepID=G0MA42_CAEBE|nr:hypothetical protein CAEBREN_20225 [Caenorhabditis brenneri]